MRKIQSEKELVASLKKEIAQREYDCRMRKSHPLLIEASRKVVQAYKKIPKSLMTTAMFDLLNSARAALKAAGVEP